MNYQEALEWLRGNRSMTNIIPEHPFETWQVRIAQADAAYTQRAYWIAKAHSEGLQYASDEVFPHEIDEATP